jgi:DNA invertase Pin-like site-specific DNA recombinase
MARMFGYGRASSDKQQITLLAQEEVCASYFKLKQLQEADWEYAGWFPDAAITSKIPLFERPMGVNILGTIAPGDTIVVSNFDRAFRSVIDCHNCMLLCSERKFFLVILDVNVDTQTPMGRAFMKIMAVIKELEREEISRRTKEAQQYNLRMGKRHSFGFPVGWKKDTAVRNGLIPCLEDRLLAKEVVHLIDVKKMTTRQVEALFKTRNLRSASGGTWYQRRVRLSYVAAKCGFPRIYFRHLPNMAELKKYMDAHAGRPPLLQHGAWRAGLLHTLPPNMGPLPAADVLDSPAHLLPSAPSSEVVAVSPHDAPDLQR